MNPDTCKTRTSVARLLCWTRKIIFKRFYFNRKPELQRGSDFPSTGMFHKWPQGLSWADLKLEPRSFARISYLVAGAQALGHPLLLSQAKTENWIRNKTAEALTGTHMGYWHYKQKIGLHVSTPAPIVVAPSQMIWKRNVGMCVYMHIWLYGYNKHMENNQRNIMLTTLGKKSVQLITMDVKLTSLLFIPLHLLNLKCCLICQQKWLNIGMGRMQYTSNHNFFN